MCPSARQRCYHPNVDVFDVQRQTQDNLVTFLKTELDLASTMLKISKTTRNQDHRKRLVQNIQTAVDTVHHFEGRIKDWGPKKQAPRRCDLVGDGATEPVRVGLRGFRRARLIRIQRSAAGESEN